MSHIGNYGFMPQTTDYNNEGIANIAQAGMEFETDASSSLDLLDDALGGSRRGSLKSFGGLTTFDGSHSSGQNQKPTI